LRQSDIPEDHKQRLLNRLEKLQAELHKKTSDLDNFVGFVADFGMMLGKFGKKVKPLVDRVTELADIAVRVMSAGHGVPQLTDEKRKTLLLSSNEKSGEAHEGEIVEG
jgi:hypothetical protein